MAKFPQKSENEIFSTPQTMLREKSLKILMRGSQKKCGKPSFLVILAKFRPNLRNFLRLQILCFEQKLGHSDAWFGKKMQKTFIFGHLGQKGPFWTVFGQNGENFQKSAWNIFLAPTSPN